MFTKYLAISTSFSNTECGSVVPYSRRGDIKHLLERERDPKDTLEVHYEGYFSYFAQKSIRHLPSLDSLAEGFSQALQQAKREA